MKILLTGAGGQLGTSFQAVCSEEAELTVCDYPDFDLADPLSVARFIAEENYDWVVNAAAYTAVDRAEEEPEKAEAVNASGVRFLAGQVQKTGGRLVQISTDFVFSGEKSSPYLPEDSPGPLSVYGKTKYEGERAVIDVFGEDSLIIRTAWLYSETGNNFVKTMLRLMKEKDELSVVSDQTGTPCYAGGLAGAVMKAIENNCRGIFHWTDAGIASWYDFAVAIQEESLALGLLDKKIPIHPIPSKAYPTPAVRPYYSVLDKTSAIRTFGIEPFHWRVRLREMLEKQSNS